MASEIGPDSSTSGASVEAPSLPLPIFRLSQTRSKYLLYDINTVTWLRQTHHILGVTIGGMPQFPQQNMFFGLPIELMPEEVKLLVEEGVALIVDDLEGHLQLMARLQNGDSYAAEAVRGQREYAQRVADETKEETIKIRVQESEKVREMKGLLSKSHNKTPDLVHNPAHTSSSAPADESAVPVDDLLFDVAKEIKRSKKSTEKDASWALTPTTASALRSGSSLVSSQKPVDVPDSRYYIYKELHERGYFMTPGIRFGCQFTAYPGDPLRYHSHFLATGYDWEEEFDLLDIVGGGRLGTGVKKGYLLGGRSLEAGHERTRAFCIEWGGM